MLTVTILKVKPSKYCVSKLGKVVHKFKAKVLKDLFCSKTWHFKTNLKSLNVWKPICLKTL